MLGDTNSYKFATTFIGYLHWLPSFLTVMVDFFWWSETVVNFQRLKTALELVGAANNLSLIAQSDLDEHVPNWNVPPHKNEMPCALLTWMGVKQDDLRRAMHLQRVHNRYLDN